MDLDSSHNVEEGHGLVFDELAWSEGAHGCFQQWQGIYEHCLLSLLRVGEPVEVS